MLYNKEKVLGGFCASVSDPAMTRLVTYDAAVQNAPAPENNPS